MSHLLLKEFRDHSGLNQREIALLLNTSQAHYHRLETGKSLPNSKQILKLCEIFKCSPNDLFGFRGVHTVSMAELD
jgi:DNA-binding XRE family transcriptional regulator